MTTWPYGSQHQLRRWITERPDELNHALTSRNDDLAGWAHKIEWLWPTAASGAEQRDGAWALIGLDEPSPTAAGWWPRRGQVWDAGARVHGPDGQIGGLLVEAKGRENELTTTLGCTATSEQSIETITSALADVQNALNVAPSPEWMGACYQPANPLAALWYARIKRDPPVPVWLVSLYFTGERYKTVTGAIVGPASAEEWEPIIESLHRRMGLPPAPHLLTPWWIEAFLPALEPTGGWPPTR